MSALTYSCLVLDDQAEPAEQIALYIESIPYCRVVAICHSPAEALNLLEKQRVEILVTDISMPGLNGLEVAMAAQHLDLAIIFITAHSEFAINAFQVNALYYLVKPVAFEQFVPAMQRAIKYVELKRTGQKEEKQHSVWVKTSAKAGVEISLSEIYFVEAANNYVHIHLENSLIVATTKLVEMEKSLPESDFLLVHRSYIIAIDKIERRESNQFILKNGQTVPIGRSLLGTIKRKFA